MVKEISVNIFRKIEGSANIVEVVPAVKLCFPEKFRFPKKNCIWISPSWWMSAILQNVGGDTLGFSLPAPFAKKTCHQCKNLRAML